MVKLFNSVFLKSVKSKVFYYGWFFHKPEEGKKGKENRGLAGVIKKSLMSWQDILS